MKLTEHITYQGNILFRYRGQIPIVIFLAAIPVIIWYTDYFSYNEYWMTTFTFLPIGLTIIGLCIRAWAVGSTPPGTSGRNTKQQVADHLNTKGVYSMVRHPLYLGNYLVWIGIVLFAMNFVFALVVTLFYWIYYERIMIAEEAFLEKKYGKRYLQWCNRTPAFIPSLGLYQKSDIPFSLKRVLRREYSGIFATVAGLLYVEVLTDYSMARKFVFDPFEASVLAVALIVTLVLRTLKHKTQLLHERQAS